MVTGAQYGWSGNLNVSNNDSNGYFVVKKLFEE